MEHDVVRTESLEQEAAAGRKERDGDRKTRGGNAEEADGAEGDNKAESPKRKEARKPHPIELALTAVSSLMILSAAGYLVWQGGQTTQPAAFEIVLKEPRASGSFYQVPVEVRNTGDEAAQAVDLEVTCTWPGQPEESSKTSIDWLPGHSRRRATVLFEDDPTSGRLKARVEGFQEP